jgi:hypothetical protein
MFFGDISGRLSGGGDTGGGTELVDGYGDQSMSEYTDYEANGGITPYGFTADAYEGDYALVLSDDTSYAKHVSTSGRPYYPGKGDKIVFYTYHSTTTDTLNGGWYYGATDLSNLYFTRLNPSAGSLTLEEKSGGANTTIVSMNATPDSGWLEWTIEWGDGSSFGIAEDDHRLVVRRVDDGSVIVDGTGTATNHITADGGVGHWGAVAAGEELRWDYSHVTNAGPTGVTVIEDWEDSSPKSEWSDNVDGSLTAFEVQTSGSRHGGYWMQNTDTEYFQINSETGGLNYYPQQGDAVEWYAYTGDLYAVFTWALPDDRDSYWGRPRVGDDELEMELAGTRYETAVAAGVDPDTWYKLRLEWDDGSTFGGAAGEQTLYLYDLDDNELASVSGTDTANVDPQGVAIGGEAGAGIDYIREVAYDPGAKPVADFETDLSAWSGDTADYALTTTAAQHGDTGLDAQTNSYVQIDSQPGDGLNYYPQQGDAIEWYMNPGDLYGLVIWGAQNAGDVTYYGRPRVDNDVLQLVLDGTTHEVAQTFDARTWYQFRLEWDDGSTFGGSAGDMTLYAFDMDGNELASLTANDTTYTSGGVGVAVADLDGMADYIRKTNTT